MKDLALLDLKFGFSMQKSSHGTPPELIWLDSDDFTSIFGLFEISVSKQIYFLRLVEVLEGLKSSGRLVGKKST